jgi:hypothetical protein
VPIPVFNQSGDVPIVSLISNAPRRLLSASRNLRFAKKHECITADNSRCCKKGVRLPCKYRRSTLSVRYATGSAEHTLSKQTEKQAWPPIKSSHHLCLAHVFSAILWSGRLGPSRRASLTYHGTYPEYELDSIAPHHLAYAHRFPCHRIEKPCDLQAPGGVPWAAVVFK